jgi:hypothetical protein
MHHACLCTICFVFCFTSWRFYAFSGTNLLTRCHSASSLFPVVFVFQKSYIGNILRIGRNKAQTSYCSRTQDEDRRRAGGGPGSSHTKGWRASPLLAMPGGGVGPLVALWCRISAYIKPTNSETLNQSVFFEKEFCSSATATDEIWGIEVSVPAPCRDGEVPPEPSPSTPLPPPLSPSTSPPSPSTLLSPMMRRE